MVFADKVIDIIDVLENDGVVLMPTDTVWCMACNLKSEFALRKIRTIVNINEKVTVCVESIPALKKYIPKLHPRVETLLCYYERPITILDAHCIGIPEHILKGQHPSLGFTASNDDFVKTILSLLGGPILLTTAHFKDEEKPKSWLEVNDIFKRNADYVCRHRMFETQMEEGICVGYDYEGMLIFDEDEANYQLNG